mgnify:CR=1 FL=1
MAAAATVDVAEVLETRKVGSFQLGIWFLAFLMLFMDGFDLSGALVGAAALSAVLIYSFAAIGCGFITELHRMLYWRFAAGPGFGGIMLTAIAYLVEIAPKRYRVAAAGAAPSDRPVPVAASAGE